MDDSRREDIAHQIEQIDETQLRRHVTALTEAGPRSVSNQHATRHSVRYIKSQLARYGYQPLEETVGTRQSAQHGEYAFANILAEHPAAVNSTPVLELGAHYDSVEESPGADDNASGVAAVLEIARILSSTQARRRVRFCFFALEEYGRDGSTFHVQALRERNEDIHGAIIFEMIGYATDRPDTQATPARIPFLFWPPRTGNFIAVVGNFRSGGLGNRFEQAVDVYVPALPYFSANRLGGLFKDALRSDHKPYWDSGYPAIMLTDTANFRNPNYHRPSDIANTLNYRFLQRVTRATAATILEWSEGKTGSGNGDRRY